MSRFAPRHILCPIDLSPPSSTVLGYARLFAKTFHSKVEVLHADWLEWPPYFMPSQAEELAAQARKHRAAIGEDLSRLAREALGPDIPYEIAIVEGHPVETILHLAAERQADLILMGSHGRSGIARLRLGSVAENVAREATTPTLIVRAASNQPAPPVIARVLCPVSFTELGRRCVESSSETAAAFGATLYVLHVVEQASLDPEATREHLCRWIPEQVRKNCDLMEVVRRGDAAEQILVAAGERAADLIVLGTQHRPFLEFTTLGTTTERVVRHANSPVLVLPQTGSTSS
jgi:nucleotide-binding universal stress UspA family protein